MKKIIASLSTLILCLAMACPVLAADFVPSISYKPAPGLVTTTGEDGKEIVGYIRDGQGNIITTEHKDCFVITPVSDADSLDNVSADAKNSLLNAYNDLVTGKKKLSDIEGLNELAEKVLGEGKDADDFVIRDFFDVTMICGDSDKLKVDGNTLDLTFDLGIAAGTYVNAMVYLNNEWVLLEKVVNNGDGTVTCTFEDLCPVAFFVPGESTESGAVTPNTGDSANITMWTAVAAVSLVSIIALVVVYRRKMYK